MRFCVGLLIISLLFPPVTVASVMMACLSGDMDMQTMDHPMDEAHACCTAMPQETEACGHSTTSMTCCPDVMVARHQDHTRTMPLSQYDAQISLSMAMPFPMAAAVNMVVLPKRFSAQNIAYLDDASPPLHDLFCIYLI